MFLPRDLSDLQRKTPCDRKYPVSHTGVPPGVINIVFGTGPRAGEALVSHPEVPLISFTGSQPTAERITQLSAPHCKKLSLELGGKNPAIIFEDANLEECIPTTIRSSFANQVCSLHVPLPQGPTNLHLFHQSAKHSSG